MIRVLHIVKDMNLGGIETFLMSQYRRLDRSKVQYDFLMRNAAKSYYDEEIERLGGRIYRVPDFHPLTYKRHLRALDQFFARHPEYRVVITASVLGMYALRAAKAAGVPVRIAHAQASQILEFNLKYPFMKHAVHGLNAVTTHRFGCSAEAAVMHFGPKVLQADDYRFMPNAIDVEQYLFSETRRAIKRREMGFDGKLVFGSVGRFARIKNFPFLVEVFHHLHKARPDSLLVLIGAGETLEQTRAVVSRLGLNDSVMLLGYRDDKEDLLQAMDYFVIPSIREGLPLVAVEAQAAGLKCFASTGIPREAKILDSFQFLDLKAGAAQWARAILAGLEYQRENTYNVMRSAGFDVRALAEELTRFYTSFGDCSAGKGQS